MDNTLLRSRAHEPHSSHSSDLGVSRAENCEALLDAVS